MRWLTALMAAVSLVACHKKVERPVATPLQFQRASADSVQHGKRIASVLGCVGCHGDTLAGEEDFNEPGFGRLWTANLSRVVPSYDDAQLARVITGGARKDRALWGMPSHLFTRLTPDDMAAVIAFLRSVPPTGDLHPPPFFEAAAQKEIAAGTFNSSAVDVKSEGTSWPPDAGPTHALGRYIVRATCAECHGMNLRGGPPHPGANARPDLRIVASYDLTAFHHLLRTGKAAGEREISLMSRVARGRFTHLTDGEIAAIYGYLQAVGRKNG